MLIKDLAETLERVELRLRVAGVARWFAAVRFFGSTIIVIVHVLPRLTPYFKMSRLVRRPGRRALLSLKMFITLPIFVQRLVMQSIAPNKIRHIKEKQSAH